MTTSNPVPLKIRRLCWLVRAVGVALLASVLFLYLASWLLPDLALWDQHWARMARIGGLPVKAANAFSGGARFLVGALMLPYLACLVWAFHHLNRLLAGFERGDFFERVTVKHLRGFAGYLLLAKALSLAAVHVRVAMYLPLSTGAGPRVAFDITSDDLALLLLCALIFLIAHLMEEGDRLAEENRGFL
jgi:hypothetical protein